MFTVLQLIYDLDLHKAQSQSSRSYVVLVTKVILQVTLSWKTPQTYGDASLVGYKVVKDGQQYGHVLKREAVHVTISDLKTGKVFV